MRALFRPLGPILVLAALTLAACDSAAKRAETHYQKALQLVAAGDTARADVEFRTVFKLAPEHEAARLAYARMLRDQGEVQEAMAQYQHLVDQDPDDLEALKDLTDLALKVQDFATARSSGDRAFTLAPDDLQVRAFKAALDYRGEDRAAAVLMAKGVIAAAPASIPARMVLVADRLAANAPGDALAQADAGLALTPDDEGLHLARLAALEAAGDTAAVKAELLAMADRFPDNAGVRQALIQLYLRAGDTDAAEAVLRELAARTPDEPQGYLTVVQFLLQLRGPDAALAELDRLIAAHPDSLPFRRARAGLDFAQGRTDAAIAAMHALVDGAEPSDSIRDTQVALAGMLASVGDTAGRDALLATVLQGDPANVDALKLRARGEVAGDQPDLAIEDMRTALGQAPNDPEVMTIMAYAHDRNGNRDLAAESFSRAVEASGQGVQESLNYARFLMQDDRAGPAEGVIVDALRRAPENPELLDTLGRIHLARHDWPRVGQVAELLRKTGDPQAARMADALEAASLQGQNRTGDTIAMLKDLADSGGGGQAMADLMRAYVEAGDVAGAQAYVDGVLAAGSRQRARPDDAGRAAGAARRERRRRGRLPGGDRRRPCPAPALPGAVRAPERPRPRGRRPGGARAGAGGHRPGRGPERGAALHPGRAARAGRRLRGGDRRLRDALRPRQQRHDDRQQPREPAQQPAQRPGEPGARLRHRPAAEILRRAVFPGHLRLDPAAARRRRAGARLPRAGGAGAAAERAGAVPPRRGAAAPAATGPRRGPASPGWWRWPAAPTAAARPCRRSRRPGRGWPRSTPPPAPRPPPRPTPPRRRRRPEATAEPGSVLTIRLKSGDKHPQRDCRAFWKSLSKTAGVCVGEYRVTLRFALAGAVLAVASAVAPLAQAATVFTFSGGSDYLLPSDFDPAPTVPELGAGTTVLRNATLGLSGPGRVSFSYLGTEAGYENRFLAGGMSFDNQSGSNPAFQQVFGAGPLDFAFDTVSPAQQVANGGAHDELPRLDRALQAQRHLGLRAVQRRRRRRQGLRRHGGAHGRGAGAAARRRLAAGVRARRAGADEAAQGGGLTPADRAGGGDRSGPAGPEAAKHLRQVVLATEEHRQDPDLARSLVDQEVENRPVLGHLPEAGPDLLPERALEGGAAEALHIVLDGSQARDCALERRPDRLAERLVGLDQVVEDEFEIPIAGARPDDLKGQARAAWRRSWPRCRSGPRQP